MTGLEEPLGAAGTLHSRKRCNLAIISDLEVSIKDLKYECHSSPFVTKSSVFKESHTAFNVADPKDNAGEEVLRIDLSELPGGSQAFELILEFCYVSRVSITKENVLDLLSAANFLGFTEDMVQDNLCLRCQRFIEMEITNSNVQGILSMLAYLANDKSVTDYGFLFTILARHALELQESHSPDNEEEIVELLRGLTKLKPGFVHAALQAFENQGVNLVHFIWRAETTTDWLSYEVEACSNACFILSFFCEALDRCIASGEVQVDEVDPRKLVLLWTPSVLLKGPTLSEEVIKSYVSSQLIYLQAEDIMCLSPQLVVELISMAVSSSRTISEVQRLAGLLDQFLVLGAERSLWDVSPKESFKQLAECIPLNVRESHDLLFDAVTRFSMSFSQAEATEFFNMIDVAKLSDTKVDSAIGFCLSHHNNYWVRLLRRREDIHNSCKRKLTAYVEAESKRSRSSMIPDYHDRHFSIFVRSLNGKILCLLVQPDTTIYSIKEQIGNKSSMEVQRSWWLIYHRKKLLEPVTIANYGIQKDSTLCIKVSFREDGEVASGSSL